MRFVSDVPGRRALSRRPFSAALATASPSRSRRTLLQAGELRPQRFLGHLQQRDFERLPWIGKSIDADDRALTVVDLALEPVGGVRDLALRIARRDRRDHPAARVDLVEVPPDGAFGLVRERLDEP